MEPWSLAVPDWQDRIRAGRSLLPELPQLDRAQAARAIAIFNKLRLPDVVGTPALAEGGRTGSARSSAPCMARSTRSPGSG